VYHYRVDWGGGECASLKPLQALTFALARNEGGIRTHGTDYTPRWAFLLEMASDFPIWNGLDGDSGIEHPIGDPSYRRCERWSELSGDK